jgi:hypothetical protein
VSQVIADPHAVTTGRRPSTRQKWSWVPTNGSRVAPNVCT